MQQRNQALDFLRGIAIILVLFRHKQLFTFSQTMGWIGVDLFFVLSGFLVSGLLFKEYLKFGNFSPKLFLIRRGFKIYPVFYLSLVPFLIFIVYINKFSLTYFFSEIFFVQNYVTGFGWALNGVSWSLAVEEHFYIGLSVSLFLLLKFKILNLIPKNKDKFGSFEYGIFIIMILCNLLRFLHNYYDFENYERNFTMTHLRIDSLLAGVLVSYLFYFKQQLLIKIYNKYKYHFVFFSLLLVSYTPFIEPYNSFFVKTLGFTMLYIAFSLILIIFLLSNSILNYLNRFLSPLLVNLIAKTGFY